MRLVATIAWLRVRLLLNGLRRTEGLISALGGLVLALSAASGAIALALGVGVLVARMAQREDGASALPLIYRVVLHGCFAFGVVAPAVVQGGSHGLDVTRLRRFPVRRTSLYAVVLATTAASPEHLFYYPTLVALGLAGAARFGQSEPTTAALLVAYAATLVVWSHAIGLVMQRALRGRRLREGLGLAFLVALMFVGFGPLLFLDAGDDAPGVVRRFFASDAAAALAAALPAEIAARGLVGLATNEGAGGALAKLLVWVAAGLALGRVAFSWLQDGESERGSRSRRASVAAVRAPAWLDRAAGALLPDETWAVAAKDWRYLVRSVVGRFVLVMLPLVTAMLAFAIGRDAGATVLGMRASELAFYAVVGYVPMALNVLVNNSFAWEAAGVQSYFLAPARLGRALVGKNLALAAFATLAALLAAVGWCAFAGPPPAYVAVAAALLHVAGMATFLALGNFVSLSFASPRRVAALNNALPGGAMLVSVGTLACVIAQTAAGVFLPALVGGRWWSVAAAVVVLVVALSVYAALLPIAARWMARRREGLVAALRAGA